MGEDIITELETVKPVTGTNRDEQGKFIPGVSGNPNGRPPETIEQKIMKKAVKELIAEYKEGLTDALAKIQPVLIAEALKGNMVAIKEINDRVMGKAEQKTDITSGGEALQPILVKFIDGNENDNRDSE